MEKGLLRKLRIKEFIILNTILFFIIGIMYILERVGLLTSHLGVIAGLLVLVVDMLWNLIKNKPLTLEVIFPSLTPLNDYNRRILNEENKKNPFWVSLIFVSIFSYFIFSYKSNVILMSDYEVTIILTVIMANLVTANKNHNVNYCAKHGIKEDPKTEKDLFWVAITLNLLMLFAAILVAIAEF